jgi:hypothetical protein
VDLSEKYKNTYGKLGTYNQMNVCWPVWVAVEQIQQLASWSIERDGVGCWPNAVECIFTVLVRHKLASQVEVFLVRVLLLVVAVGRGLPDIDRGAYERLVGLRAHDLAEHVYRLGVGWGVVADVGTLGQSWVVVSEEGPEDGALSGHIGCRSCFLVGDFVYQTLGCQQGDLGSTS